MILGAATGRVTIYDVRESRQPKGAQPDPNAVLPNLPQRASSVYKPLRFVRALKGHMNRVMGVAVAPDGKILATGSEGSVKLWDAATGDLVRSLEGHNGKVKGLAFTKDGKQLITGDTTSIRFWHVATGASLRTIEHPRRRTRHGFGDPPDGKTLYSCGREVNAKAWDLETGRELRVFPHGASLYTLAVSPNGAHLVTGCRERDAAGLECAERNRRRSAYQDARWEDNQRHRLSARWELARDRGRRSQDECRRVLEPWEPHASLHRGVRGRSVGRGLHSRWPLRREH